MSRWMAVALVAAQLLAVPVAAQGEGDAGGGARMAVDDPAGDTQGPLPKEGAGHLDLVHAEAAALEEGLAFWVTVASLQADAAAIAGWELWLAFEYRGVRYDLVLLPTETTVDRPDEVDRIAFGDIDGQLWRMSDAKVLGPVVTFADPPSRTFNATVPWDLIVEPGGNSPNPGEPVRLVEAASAWTPLLLGTPHNPFIVSGAEPFVTGDRAPFPDGSFLSVPGAIGDLSLATPLATRFSNGEATTLHWPVEVTNHGGRDLDATLSLSAPGGEGRAPPGVRLGPGESKVVNVYVTLPFAHDHGSQRSFQLTVDSGSGDRATLALGVDYPAIPQPAGHHPDLWLHGNVERFADALPLYGEHWMNTAEEDERSNAAQVGGDTGTCPNSPTQPLGGKTEAGTLWTFRLDPGLRMGLDARLGETASLDVTLIGAAAVPSGTLHGRLLLGSTAPDHDISTFEENLTTVVSVPVEATPGPSQVPVHLELPIPPELDLVMPSRDETLLLALLLCLDAPAPTSFAVSAASMFATLFDAQPYSLATGGHLRLPLDEYHDAIPIAGDGLGVQLSVVDPVRRAAPGAVLLWRPTVEFADGADGTFAVRLFGSAAGHARLLTEPRLPAQDTQLAVTFTVPDEAAGTVLDLLVDVTDETDPARSAALRLSVLVDPSATEDDSEELAGLGPTEKESPALPLVALLSLAFVAWRRRARL